jgi:hypothetical protein
VETHLNALGDLLQRLALNHAVRTFRLHGELTAWLAFMFSAWLIKGRENDDQGWRVLSFLKCEHWQMDAHASLKKRSFSGGYWDQKSIWPW